MPPAQRIRHTCLNKARCCLECLPQRRTRFGAGHRLKRVARGLRGLRLAQQRRQRRDGFHGADDAQPLAGGAFLGRAGTGLQCSDEVLFLVGPDGANCQRQQSGKQKAA